MLKVIKNYNLKDVRESIFYLLEKASKSTEVRQHAIQITQGKQDSIAAIYDWVKGNVAYLSDPIGPSGDEIEWFISPVRMIENHSKGLALAGDCDDHALLATALYQSLGIPSKVILAGYSDSNVEHAFCRVWSEPLQSWINCDTTVDHPLGWHFPATVEIEA